MTNLFRLPIRAASPLVPAALSLVIVTAFLTACSPPGASDSPGELSAGADGGEPAFEGAIERTRAVKVLTAPLIQREMVRAISTTVDAESETEISIFPRTTGVVTEVAVEEGDRVEAGDVLMRIDPRELESALAEADVALLESEDALAGLALAVTEAEANVSRAELTFQQSERELKRTEEAGDGVVSRNALDQLRLTVQTNDADLAALRIAKRRAETSVKSQEIAINKAKLQIERAKLDLSYATTVAPFKGVIAQRTVREGDLASSSIASFVLTDPDHVRAVVSRSQGELAFFHAAHKRANSSEQRASQAAAGDGNQLDIKIEPDALPGFVYTGHIQFISPTIDAASGQFRVTLGIDQPGEGDERPPVLPGMLLRVGIVTERHPEALVVPKRGLIREGDSFFVYVVNGKNAKRVAVREGFADDMDVEIIPAEDSTLQAGDQIIVVGNRDLDDGDSIEASLWPAAAKQPATVEAEEPADEGAEGDEADGEGAASSEDEGSTK